MAPRRALRRASLSGRAVYAFNPGPTPYASAKRVSQSGYSRQVGCELTFGLATVGAQGVRFVTAPRETFKGAGCSRKAGAGAGEAVRWGHFFSPSFSNRFDSRIPQKSS